MQELINYLKEKTSELGRRAQANFYSNEQNIQVKDGNANNIASESDRRINEIFIRDTRNRFPDVGLITEEYETINPNSETKIYFDPIDGSNNFTDQDGLFATMSALEHDGKTIYSAIYIPFFKFLFTAELGKGAYLNGRQIFVSKHSELKSSRGFTNDSLKDSRINFLNELSKICPKIWAQAIGCCGVSAASVARGKKHWFISNGSGGDWDHKPIILLVTEAGGVARRLDGKPWKYELGVPYVLSNEILAKKIVKLFN